MMVRLRYIFVMLMIAFVAFGSGCNRRTTISDDELARIFRDAFLANSYVTNERLRLDSLRVYEPIFNSYGYTVEDVQYTLGNFAMRKSARLGDVVEAAISMLERRGVALDREVAILDTLDSKVIRRASSIVYSDTLRHITSWRDTSKLRFVIEDPLRGNYRMRFKCKIATPKGDRSSYRTGWQSEHIISGGSIDGSDSVHVVLQRGVQLRKNSVILSVDTSLSVVDSIDRIVVDLAKITNLDADPDILIRDLRIDRVPSITDSRSEEFGRFVDINIFSDELLFAKDSL